MTDTADDRPLSVTETAEYMQLGVEATRQLIDDGLIAAVRLNQKHCVVMKSTVVAFMHEQARTQTAARRAQHPGTPTSTLRAAAKPRRRGKQQRPDLSKYEQQQGAE